MQEELFRTLRRVGISDASVELENVTLNREQNMLTVFFRCENEPSIDLTRQLTDDLESRLGGTRVRVEWQAKNQPQSFVPETIEPATPVTKPSTNDGKSSPSGKRVLYGGFVSSNCLTPMVNLKNGADKCIIGGTIVSINERNSFKNKRRKGEMSFPLDISLSDGTDSIYCSLLIDTEEQKNALVSELESAQKSGSQILAQGACRTSQITGELMFYANNVSNVKKP